MAVKNYTTQQLLNRVKTLPSFKQIPTGIWLLGVRAEKCIPDTFCDKMYQFNGESFLQVTTCTTDPGAAGLLNYKQFNTDGIGVVKDEEWYYNLWTYGLHKEKMPALKQVGNIKYFRDSDGDKFPEEIGVVHEGVIGIDWHTATYLTDPKIISTLVVPTVGTWSLGCQVQNDVEDYYNMLNRMKSASVSYCLIKEF